MKTDLEKRLDKACKECQYNKRCPVEFIPIKNCKVKKIMRTQVKK